MRYLTIIIVLLLCGCESKETNNIPMGKGDVKEVSLSDGTKCAVYSGTYGGGISCDWRGKNK